MIARLSLTLAAALNAVAAPVPAENLRDNETRQVQIQGDARELAAAMAAMLEEYSRNGLAGEDAEIVKKLRDSLQRLTSAEMKGVIDLLQAARATGDEGTAKKTVADAYAMQKGILSHMTRLIADHGRAQEALELSQAAARLADRQAANLQNGIDLGKWVGGKKPEDFEQAMQANLEGQRTEQAAYGAAIVAAIESARPHARVVYGGDLNVFPRPDDPIATSDTDTPSDQLKPLYDLGLHNLWQDLAAQVPGSAYSYVFQGQAQTLDHMFVNAALHADLVQVRTAHINADWAAEHDGDGSRGASDHDPQILSILTGCNTDPLPTRCRPGSPVVDE